MVILRSRVLPLSSVMVIFTTASDPSSFRACEALSMMSRGEGPPAWAFVPGSRNAAPTANAKPKLMKVFLRGRWVITRFSGGFLRVLRKLLDGNAREKLQIFLGQKCCPGLRDPVGFRR